MQLHRLGQRDRARSALSSVWDLQNDSGNRRDLTFAPGFEADYGIYLTHDDAAFIRPQQWWRLVTWIHRTLPLPQLDPLPPDNGKSITFRFCPISG